MAKTQDDLTYLRRVNGFEFKYREYSNGNPHYECRGDYWYDEMGDEVLEPGLVTAARKLEQDLIDEGYQAELCWSEKGWISVDVNFKVL